MSLNKLGSVAVFDNTLNKNSTFDCSGNSGEYDLSGDFGLGEGDLYLGECFFADRLALILIQRFVSGFLTLPSGQSFNLGDELRLVDRLALCLLLRLADRLALCLLLRLADRLALILIQRFVSGFLTLPSEQSFNLRDELRLADRLALILIQRFVSGFLTLPSRQSFNLRDELRPIYFIIIIIIIIKHYYTFGDLKRRFL